jgi:hypothetical protein
VSFAAINLCFSSQRVFVVAGVISLSIQSGNFSIHPRIRGSEEKVTLLPQPGIEPRSS